MALPYSEWLEVNDGPGPWKLLQLFIAFIDKGTQQKTEVDFQVSHKGEGALVEAAVSEIRLLDRVGLHLKSRPVEMTGKVLQLRGVDPAQELNFMAFYDPMQRKGSLQLY